MKLTTRLLLAIAVCMSCIGTINLKVIHIDSLFSYAHTHYEVFRINHRTDKGSTFWFEIPDDLPCGREKHIEVSEIAAGDDEMIRVEAEEADINTSSVSLLIAEDERELLNFLKRNLLHKRSMIKERYGALNDNLSAMEGTFYKKIKDVTGLGIMEYVTKRRMATAAGLLSKTRLPISEIAVRTGYSNNQYFNKVFRKHFNMSPSSYRNQSSPEDVT